MKKHGFTLIELLAVIVILAIIALIATPIVMNLIENSKRGAAERTAESIEKAAELYYYENRLDGVFPGITFTCNGEKCSSNDKVLQINGKVPEVGSIKIDKEGVITLNSIIINGYNCYKENKSYKCGKVSKGTTSSTDGVLTLDSNAISLSNYRIYGNSVNSDILVENLPSEYQQVEYIESTGTQYIDTGYIPKSNTIINVDFKTLKQYNDPFTSLFGTQTNSGEIGRAYILFGSTNNIQVNIPRNAIEYASLNNDGTIGKNTVSSNTYWNALRTVYTMDIEKKEIVIGDKTWNLSSYFTQDFVSPKYNLYLLTRNSAGVADSNCSKGYLYGTTIYEGSTLIHKFVPCYKKSNNVIGLYDLVGGKFYENKGTGELLKGPNVTGDIVYRESVGNYNSSTGQYEVPIKVIGKNLFDFNSITTFFRANSTKIPTDYEINSDMLVSHMGLNGLGVYINSNIDSLSPGKYTLSVDAMSSGSSNAVNIGYKYYGLDGALPVNSAYRYLSKFNVWERISYTFTITNETEIVGFTFQGLGTASDYNDVKVKFKNI